MRCGQVSGKNPSQLDLIDVRKMGFEVGIALFGDQVLPGGLTVVGVNFVDCVHAFDDGAERSKAYAVEAGVVGVIDEKLPGAGIGAGRGEDDGSALVALNDGIVLDLRGVPDLVNGRVGAEPELRDEARDHAKEGRISEIAVANQVVKAVCAEGCPVAMDFDHKFARSGRELCLEDHGRLELERRRVKQRPACANSGAAGSTDLRRGAFRSRRLGLNEKACTQNDDRRNCFHDDRLYKTAERLEVRGRFEAKIRQREE